MLNDMNGFPPVAMPLNKVGPSAGAMGSALLRCSCICARARISAGGSIARGRCAHQLLNDAAQVRLGATLRHRRRQRHARAPKHALGFDGKQRGEVAVASAARRRVAVGTSPRAGARLSLAGQRLGARGDAAAEALHRVLRLAQQYGAQQAGRRPAGQRHREAPRAKAALAVHLTALAGAHGVLVLVEEGRAPERFADELIQRAARRAGARAVCAAWEAAAEPHHHARAVQRARLLVAAVGGVNAVTQRRSGFAAAQAAI